MCMSCGCKQPNENHGDERHITMQNLEQAAEANETSVDEVVSNIQETYDEAGDGQGAGAASGSGQRSGS